MINQQKLLPLALFHRNRSLAVALVVASGTGCSGSTATGDLDVLLESEDVIVEGLVAGSEGENIQDGWDVSFSRYIAAVGPVHLTQGGDASTEVEAEETHVVDLSKLTAGTLSLWSFADLEEGRWDFNYETPVTTSSANRDASVSEEDFDAMVAAGWTYLIDGTMTRADGVSCPPAALATPGDATPTGETNAGGDDCYTAPSINFVFGAAAGTEFGPCEIDEVPGIVVVSGDTKTAAATIHGDHLFFNGFPEGNEGGISRLAQWLADCDLNLDGTVTADELTAIAPEQLSEIDERFQLGGSPISPLTNMYEYLRAQMKTQGHFQGEGECALDVEAH
jgi:hypothetical protein